jgi:hypothetical protein
VQQLEQQLEQRRTSPRHEIPDGWTTRYRVVGSSDGNGWREARLVDLTEASAAIEPFGLGPDESLAGTLELNIVAPGGCPTGVLLRGELRHATTIPCGKVRVGISFPGLDGQKAAFLELLDRLAEAHGGAPRAR